MKSQPAKNINLLMNPSRLSAQWFRFRNFSPEQV
jgi:hypothetical protein